MKCTMKGSTPPKGHDIHPFLRGNFAPVTDEYISHSCQVVHGTIPEALLGGQYIRNGGNPVYPPDKGRHYHWFDGDGMLHGVLFPNDPSSPPTYTNRHLATPLLTLTLLLLRSPLPSIALLISPLSSLHRIVVAIIQAFLILLRARMGVLSVANTAVIWWGQGLGKEAEEEAKVEAAISIEGGSGGRRKFRRMNSLVREYRKDHRLLATCESGPPLEVRVPGLETVWWDRLRDEQGENLAMRRGKSEWWRRWSLTRVQEDWMTAHPRVDPVDGSLIFYSTQMFDTPHVRYSVINRRGKHLVWKEPIDVGRAKMMHDFAATRTHSILLNLPLTLTPANLFSLPPVPLIHFDRTLPSEFVIFPRLLNAPETPQHPVRFSEPEPSLIFHTANAWDECGPSGGLVAINMLACRFRSSKLVYAAGAVDIPKVEAEIGVDDVVRLHYYRFALPPAYGTSSNPTKGVITHSFPLSTIPFEFPTMPTDLGMSPARYVYGCTMRSGSFDERLGGAAKVDCLAKVDVQTLVERGRARGEGKNMDPVDGQSSAQILEDWRKGIKGSVEIFAFPEGWFAQEPRFVQRAGEGLEEDDGYLLSYAYDERFLLPDGTPSNASDAGSELWIIDAKRMGDGMSSVVCRIKLPQRVPYGLHGIWLPSSLTRHQRSLPFTLPEQPLLQHKLLRSRIQYFVSILFDRPSSREMSRFERAVLAVLWPAACGTFGLAVCEVVKHVLEGSGGGVVGMRERGVLEGRWERNFTFEMKGEGAPGWDFVGYWPQVVALFLVFTTIVYRFPKRPVPAASPPLQAL